jgi:hypothetical protein
MEQEGRMRSPSWSNVNGTMSSRSISASVEAAELAGRL